MTLAAILTISSIPAALSDQTWQFVALIGVSAMGHGIWATNVITIHSDVIHYRTVASLYGITALGSGLGGVLVTQITGLVADTWHSFTPRFIAAVLMPLCGTGLLMYWAEEWNRSARRLSNRNEKAGSHSTLLICC